MSLDKNKIDRVVDERIDAYKQIALDIYGKPEVSNYEFFACQRLADQLKQEGFEVKVDVAGHRTGFDARYRSAKPGPVVAFYAEYDALGGIGHACGHNLLGTTSSLAAVALKSVIDETGGEVRVYGTPGEEGGENGSAKGSFVREGFFKDVDFSLGAHPGHLHHRTSETLAVNPIDVEFFGRSAHASSSPEKGINALDGVILSYNGVNALRQHLPSDVRIHGIITNGGLAPNVVPDYASAKFYLRARFRPDLDVLQEKFEHIVKGAALATGADSKVALFQNSVDNTVITPLFDDVYEKVLNSYGQEMTIREDILSRGSSDVGNISQVVPVIQPVINISDEYIAGHSLEFREAAKSEKGLESIRLGAKVLAHTALTVLLDDELLKRIKAQHRERVENQGK